MNNSTVSENQTSPLAPSCSKTAYALTTAVIALDFTVFLPFQIWILWLGISNLRIRGRLAASEIFTMNLSALEILSTILYSISVVAHSFNNRELILLVTFFSGSYLVGRPFMNSLICVERYIAVAHPVIYRSPAFVKHRYIAVGLVWMLVVAYGGFAIFTNPSRVEVYIFALTFSLLVISACSLGVLKILLRPSPGETQKEGMDRQKKRAFIIITGVLVGISVPYGLDLFIFSFKRDIYQNAFCVLFAINMWLLQQASIIHPVLYLSKHGKFSCIKKLTNKC